MLLLKKPSGLRPQNILFALFLLFSISCQETLREDIPSSAADKSQVLQLPHAFDAANYQHFLSDRGGDGERTDISVIIPSTAMLEQIYDYLMEYEVNAPFWSDMLQYYGYPGWNKSIKKGSEDGICFVTIPILLDEEVTGILKYWQSDTDYEIRFEAREAALALTQNTVPTDIEDLHYWRGVIYDFIGFDAFIYNIQDVQLATWFLNNRFDPNLESLPRGYWICESTCTDWFQWDPNNEDWIFLDTSCGEPECFYVGSSSSSFLGGNTGGTVNIPNDGAGNGGEGNGNGGDVDENEHEGYVNVLGLKREKLDNLLDNCGTIFNKIKIEQLINDVQEAGLYSSCDPDITSEELVLDLFLSVLIDIVDCNLEQVRDEVVAVVEIDDCINPTPVSCKSFNFWTYPGLRVARLKELSLFIITENPGGYPPYSAQPCPDYQIEISLPTSFDHNGINYDIPEGFAQEVVADAWNTVHESLEIGQFPAATCPEGEELFTTALTATLTIDLWTAVVNMHELAWSPLPTWSGPLVATTEYTPFFPEIEPNKLFYEYESFGFDADKCN